MPPREETEAHFRSPCPMGGGSVLLLILLALCALAWADTERAPPVLRKGIRDDGSDGAYPRGLPPTFKVIYASPVDNITQSAIETALQIVDSYLVLNPQAPIRIKFTWQAMGAVRGAAYPATYMTRPNDPPGSPSYPIALLVAQSGSYNTNSAYLRSAFDIDAKFNSKPMGGWYFGTDACPLDQYSFVSTFMHEVIHGLGWGGLFMQDATRGVIQANGDGSVPIFDTLLCSTKDETGKSVPAFPITQYKRAGGLTLLKVATQSAIVVNATKFYSIYSPNTFQTGTSLYHLNDRTKVMNYYVKQGTTLLTLSGTELDILSKIGWRTKRTRQARQMPTSSATTAATVPPPTTTNTVTTPAVLSFSSSSVASSSSFAGYGESSTSSSSSSLASSDSVATSAKPTTTTNTVTTPAVLSFSSSSSAHSSTPSASAASASASASPSSLDGPSSWPSSSSSYAVSASALAATVTGSPPDEGYDGALKIRTSLCLVPVEILSHLSLQAGVVVADAYADSCLTAANMDIAPGNDTDSPYGTVINVSFDTRDPEVYDRVAEYVRAAPVELKPYAIGAVKVVPPRQAASGSKSHKGVLIGVCVALFAVLVIVAAVVVFVIWRRQQSNGDRDELKYSLLSPN